MRWAHRLYAKVSFHASVIEAYPRCMRTIMLPFFILTATCLGQIAAGEPLPTVELTAADGSSLRVGVEGGQTTVR